MTPALAYIWEDPGDRNVMPDWLPRELDGISKRKTMTLARPNHAEGQPITVAEYRAVLSYIDPTFQGDRNAFVGIMRCILDDRVPLRLADGEDRPEPEQLAVEWARGDLWRQRTGDVGFAVPTFTYGDDQECLHDVRSSHNEGPLTGLGTLIHHAKKAGYRRRPSSARTFAPSLAANVEVVGESPKRRIFYLDEGLDRPKPAWLLPGVLPASALASIFGFPQAGKTWWGLDMALYIATGKAGYGLPDREPQDVLYFCGEGFSGFIHTRVTAWCAAHQSDPRDREGVRLRVIELPIDFSSDEDLAALYAEIDAMGMKPAAFFLDTLARVLSASGLEENTRDLGRFVHQAERLKQAFGCTVVMLHHTPVEDDSRPRGGGALTAGIDAEFRLRGNLSKQTLAAGKAMIWAECTKMKDDERDETPICFKANRVASGLVLEPITPAECEALRARVKGSDAALEALKFQVTAALEKALTGGMDEVEGPMLGTLWVEIDEARRVANGEVPREPEQMKQAAETWRTADNHSGLSRAVRDGKMDEFLARYPNGDPKRGGRSVYVFRLPVAKPRPPLEKNGPLD